MMDCDVVIVAYNSGTLLAEAVKSALLENAARVVVVDNRSTDGSVDHLETSETSSRLLIVRNERNLGFAAACNIGYRNATAKYVMFLNPDARLAPGALSILAGLLDADATIGMAGPMLLNADGTEQRGGRRNLPGLRSGLAEALVSPRIRRVLPRMFPEINLLKEDRPTLPTEVQAISGSCMLVRREAVSTVGLWDEGYFLHVEDLDYCMRFRRGGWRIVFVPQATVYHVKGTSSRARPTFIEWQKHRGMMRYYDKFLAHRRWDALSLLIKGGILVRFVFVVVLTSIRGR